jgi:hypothetical protein
MVRFDLKLNIVNGKRSCYVVDVFTILEYPLLKAKKEVN